MNKTRRKTKGSHGAVTKNGKKARKEQKAKKSLRDGCRWAQLNKLKQHPPRQEWDYPKT